MFKSVFFIVLFSAGLVIILAMMGNMLAHHEVGGIPLDTTTTTEQGSSDS